MSSPNSRIEYPSSAPDALTLPSVLQRLYVRIWLSVMVAVAVLMLLLGWAWRVTTDPPARTVVVQNLAGETIGQGAWRGTRDLDGQVPQHDDGENTPPDPATVASYAQLKSGPEFLVRMQDGQDIVIHMPRPPRSQWSRPPTGFLWVLGMVGLGAALVMYPVARRLTRRLERLQHGVERWGAGDLSARVPMSGRDEVGLLAQRFNTAAERIDLLMQSQKSLLANASHELRSPLARIRMALELSGSAPTPTVRAEIGRNIIELDQLIDEILLASRLDAKELDLDAKELDLGTMEEVDLVGLVAEEAARVNAAFELAPGVVSVIVPGVSKLLRRAVRNLLENARRYGGQDVQAELWTEGDQAVVVVNDRGPGVPAEQRERIFEPFYRMPGASESNGGVGLGLALVRSIAERHGGQASCGPREGGGARFRLALPLVSPHS